MAAQRPPGRGNNSSRPPQSNKSGGSSDRKRKGPGERRPGAPPQNRRPGAAPAGRRPASTSVHRPRTTPSGSTENAGGADRLQKILAHAGVGSRRACEELILQGRVTVDGQIVRELGTKVDPARQPVAVDGQKVHSEKPVYFAVYKPKGYVSTNNDPSGRPRVLDLLPQIPQRVYTVGRLDEMSVGLMLMTNDGDLANQLAHPKFGVEKLYRVSVAGTPTREVLTQLTEGIWLAEGKVRAKRVRAIGKRGDSTILELVLAEGKNREVRRMLAKLGHKVMTLTRVAVGPITVKGLTAGQFRPLTGREIDLLRRVAAGEPVPMPWMNDRKPQMNLDRVRRPEPSGDSAPQDRSDGPPRPPRVFDGPRSNDRPNQGSRPQGQAPRPGSRPPGPPSGPRGYLDESNRPSNRPGYRPRPPENGPSRPPGRYAQDRGPRPSGPQGHSGYRSRPPENDQPRPPGRSDQERRMGPQTGTGHRSRPPENGSPRPPGRYDQDRGPRPPGPQANSGYRSRPPEDGPPRPPGRFDQDRGPRPPRPHENTGYRSRPPENGPPRPPGRYDQDRGPRPPGPQANTGYRSRPPENGPPGRFDQDRRNGPQSGQGNRSRPPENGPPRPPGRFDQDRRNGPGPRPVSAGPNQGRKSARPPIQEPPPRKMIGMESESHPSAVDRPKPRSKPATGAGKRPTPRPTLGLRAKPKRRPDSE